MTSHPHISVIEKTENRETDYTLLVRQVEKALLENPENPKIREMLARRSVWDKLPTDRALEWATLAQIAGLPDTALEIYEAAAGREPENAAAWEACIRLLDILDDRPRLARAVATAGKHLPAEQVNAWLSREIPADTPRSGTDMDPSVDVFARMHARQERLDRYMSLFAGRQDVFARQWADKTEGKAGYVPVKRPMEKTDLEDHLKGLKTYGIYLMAQDATVRCGLIDADLVKELRGEKTPVDIAGIKKERAYMFSRLKEASKARGLSPLVEVSGAKGFHFWFFSDPPVHAAAMRTALSGMADPLAKDLSCFELEVFPKQDHLSGKGFGNLVKLPLGIHRLSGRRSYFPGCTLKDTEAQLAFLEQVTPSPSNAFETASDSAPTGKLLLHPEMKALAGEYPGLFEIQRNCPPLGQIIALAREGSGIRVREEKILFQTLGFLPDAKKVLHFLLRNDPEYNPHMVDYKLSRLRGTPLGCRRIHSLTGFTGNFCDLSPDSIGYIHPLIPIAAWQKTAEKKTPVSEKVQNLADALENLKTAIRQVERFLS